MDVNKNSDSNSMIQQNTKGRLIAFEGIDGSGKSTQIQFLAKRLKEQQIPHYTTMEPTDSPIGSLIRQILKGRLQADPRVVASLFAADRLDHLLNNVDGILHMIADGMTVLMDRYLFSSYAYQSTDAPMEWVIQANALSSRILSPAVNIFIDTDVDTAMERIIKNRFQTELFEEKTRLLQVRKRYQQAFEKVKDAGRVIIVDGNQPPEAVAEEIWENVKEYLKY